jgi:hypothetical protein
MPQPEMREPTGEFREQPGPAVHASRTTAALTALWKWPLVRVIAFSLAVGFFLSVVGAFRSGDMPYLVRAPWFLAFSLFAGLAGFGVTRLADRIAWARERGWRRFLLVGSLMTAIMSAAVWIGMGLAIGGVALAALPETLLFSSVTSFTLTGLAFAVFRRPAVTHAAAAGAAPPRFLERLPVGLKGGEIWAVEAEDHYLRIHSSRGSDLILLRLADAVAELEGIEGAQTHRSWWVARSAVKEVKRSDGRATLVLPGSVEAPVSRTYARALREAGWF